MLFDYRPLRPIWQRPGGSLTVRDDLSLGFDVYSQITSEGLLRV